MTSTCRSLAPLTLVLIGACHDAPETHEASSPAPRTYALVGTWERRVPIPREAVAMFSEVVDARVAIPQELLLDTETFTADGKWIRDVERRPSCWSRRWFVRPDGVVVPKLEDPVQQSVGWRLLQRGPASAVAEIEAAYPGESSTTRVLDISEPDQMLFCENGVENRMVRVRNAK